MGDASARYRARGPDDEFPTDAGLTPSLDTMTGSFDRAATETGLVGQSDQASTRGLKTTG